MASPREVAAVTVSCCGVTGAAATVPAVVTPAVHAAHRTTKPAESLVDNLHPIAAPGITSVVFTVVTRRLKLLFVLWSRPGPDRVSGGVTCESRVPGRHRSARRR